MGGNTVGVLRESLLGVTCKVGWGREVLHVDSEGREHGVEGRGVREDVEDCGVDAQVVAPALKRRVEVVKWSTIAYSSVLTT